MFRKVIYKNMTDHEEQQMLRSQLITILFIIGLSANTSCTLPKLFHQHIAEPVAVPEIKRKNTKSLSIGNPGELKLGYHIEKDLYVESYVQQRGLTTSQFESGNGQEALGASIHKIFGTDKRNISLGLGVDVGRSQGKNEKNSTGGRRMPDKEITEHKLSYHQAYAQASVMLHNAKEFGIGLSYKMAWGEAQYEHGIVSSERSVSPQPDLSRSMSLSETEVDQVFTNKTQAISYGTFALTLRSNLEHFVSDKINLELQLRLPGNSNNFRSNQSATFSIGYDFH